MENVSEVEFEDMKSLSKMEAIDKQKQEIVKDILDNNCNYCPLILPFPFPCLFFL